MKQLDVLEIEADERCQARARMDTEVINEYAELYRAGVKLPPVDVVRVDGKRWFLVDGWHRRAAALLAGVPFLPVNVVGEGDEDYAAWKALASNREHGLRRSNEDKRNAVTLALDNPIGSGESSRVIAEHVGVSHDFVSRLRKQWEQGKDLSPSVVGRDGRLFKRSKSGTARARMTDAALSSDDNRAPSAALSSDDKAPPNPAGSLEPHTSAQSHESAHSHAPAQWPDEDSGVMPVLDKLPPVQAERAQLAGEILAIIQRVVREFGQLKPKYPRAAQRDWAFIDEVKLARVSVQNWRPETCPACEGDGCKDCRHHGWMPGSIAKAYRRAKAVQ